MTDPAARSTPQRLAWAATGLLLGGGICYLQFRHLDGDALRTALAEVRWSWTATATLTTALITLLSAYEWRLLSPLPRSASFAVLYSIAAVTVLLQNTAHHLIGQGYAIHGLVRRARLSGPDALSVLALDQAAEGLARVVFCGGLLLVVPLPEKIVAALPAYAGLLLAFLAALGLLLLVRRRTPKSDENLYQSGLAAQIRAFLSTLIDRLQHFRNLPLLGAATLLALMKKLVKAAGVACVQVALGVEVPLYAPLVIVAAIDLATAVPLVPGHVGVFELAVVYAYQFFGVELEPALLLATLFHGVFLAAMLLPGAVVWLNQAVVRPTAATIT